MTKNNRHLLAFVITTMIYGVAIASILGINPKEKLLNEQKQPQFQSVKIAFINETPQNNTKKPLHKQQNIEKEPEKIIEKTTEKIKPEVEKVVEKKQEKPIENKIAQTVQIPQIVQKQEIKQIIEPQIVAKTQPIAQPKIEEKTQIIAKQIVAPIPKILKHEPNNEEIKNKKREYFTLVKNTIEKHKYYPQNALRRGIECDIKVKFIISSLGQLVSLELIEGNKIFHTSVKEAIENSFPLLPPKNILADNEVVNLVISYTIN